MSRHRTRSISDPNLHKSNSKTSSSTTVTKSLLNEPSSNAAVSSTIAAAASALCSRASNSVSVADVKTKRMFRRKSSASSHGDLGIASRELQALRKSSSGSMLQRSFRESSPNWSHVPMNTPPVPPLPDELLRKIPESRKGSMTSETLHTQKISRQTSSQGSKRLLESASRPVTSYYQKPSSIPTTGRMSINFSLPTDLRPNSPVTRTRFISPLTASLTSVASSSSSSLVNDTNSRKLIPDPEPPASKDVIDMIEKSPARNGSLTRSQIKRASLVTDKLPGNSSKNAKTTKNLKTGTKKSSSLSVKYSFMNKPSFFSSTNKTLTSNFELTDDQVHTTTDITTTTTTTNNNNNNNDLQYLKPLEFEKFPSNFSIDKDQFNHFDLEDSRQDPTTTFEIVDNKCSTDLFPPAKEIPLSPLLIHPAKLSDGHVLDSKISIDDLSFENNYQNAPNDASQMSIGAISVQKSDEIMEKKSPLLPTSHLSVNAKCPAAINYLTHSTNHPCKSVLKYNASPLTFCGSENLNKVSTDESYSKRRVNSVSFDENPSIVDGKPSVAFNSSSVIDFQKIRDWSNQDSENIKDLSFSMRINKIMKPRPRLPSFGSVYSKKRPEEVEELRLVRPLEETDYILSPLLPVSPLSSPTHLDPGLEMPENEENKKTNNMIISSLVRDENLDNAANIHISKNQLHNHIESIKDHSQAPNELSGSIKSLQNIKSNENLTTLTFEQMSGESNLTSKSSKILTINTSESYFTFLESPNSSLHSPSPKNLTPTSSTTVINMNLEQLHVPGAWESSNEDLDKLKIGNPQFLRISDKDSITYKTPENSNVEEDSEAASIYSDAVENIVIAENSDYISYNAISTNPAVYEEDKDDVRSQVMTKNSTNRLYFAKPKKSDASRSKRLTDLIVARLPHRQISNSPTIQPLRNMEGCRSFSLSPKSPSKPAVKENHTRSVSKGELHDSQEVKLFLPGISMRRQKSRESISSFKRARPIVRELHLRSSMREPIKPKASKFKLSSLKSSRYETESTSLIHTCHLRAVSKFRFPKIRNSHPLISPIDGMIIKKNINFPINYNEHGDFTHTTLDIRSINSSNDDTINNPEWQKSDVSPPPKTPSFQDYCDDCLDIRSDKHHQSNEISDTSNTFELIEAAGSVSPISTEQNKTISSTPNINNQILIKPKENLISMIQRMKADVNDLVRKQEKQKITTPNTTPDLQNQTFYTLKNQDSPLISPNHDSEQSPSWPLPTSESIDAQITNIKSPTLYINQTTTAMSANSPVYLCDSDKLSRKSNLTRPDSSHQKKHGSLRRILRHDG